MRLGSIPGLIVHSLAIILTFALPLDLPTATRKVLRHCRRAMEIRMTRPTPLITLLALLAAACFVMLGSALLLQHLFGWEPCTLCVQIRLWLLLGGTLSLLIIAAEAVGQRWLTLIFWPLLLATGFMAVFDNTHLVLIETGILESFSCSPFPFYAFYLPLHEYLPAVFMSAGVCGLNDYAILGVSFTNWTLLSVTLLFAFMLFVAWRAIGKARA
jgi:disulfide bond formation protein DsbB